MTQLWLAAEDRFYDFNAQGCTYSSLGGLGMLRPDAFEHAMKVDPNGTVYRGREMVDGQWTDHYVSGAGQQQFNMWTSIETNFPVFDYGPSSFSEIGLNHWSNFRVGRVPDAYFNMDVSKCKPEAAGARRPAGPLLRRSAARAAAPPARTTAGAPLWVEWVTGGQRVSTWDNTAQIHAEKVHPPSDPRQLHPFATETRWRLDGGLMAGGPAGWLFMLMEIGDTFFCAPDGCSVVLFGLESRGDDTRLHSFVTGSETAAPLIAAAVRALHANHSLTRPILNFSDLALDAVVVDYVYGFNATAGQTVFFGKGGGAIPPAAGGGTLVLQETIAPAYVAPLELFYDSTGALQTTFSKPMMYRWAADSSCPVARTPGDPVAKLCSLLIRNRKLYDISWAPPGAPNGTFQDHIPYDLVALHKLGASASQLAAAFAHHEQAEQLQPSRVSTGAVTEVNWRDHVGIPGGIAGQDPSPLNSDFLGFFRRRVASLGVNGTLDAHLPALLGGVFGKLYHGLQTLGWGYMETGVPDMAAQGLAWMATASQPPAPLAAAPIFTEPEAVLSAMHKDDRLPTFAGEPTFMYYVFLADLVANHSATLQEHATPHRTPALCRIGASRAGCRYRYDLAVADDISLDASLVLAVEMSDAALTLFAAANFSSYTSVHHVAGIHAAANVLPYLRSAADRSRLLRRLWQALVYNVAIQNRPPMSMPPLGAPRTWKQITEAALRQYDVHLHELVVYASRDKHGLPDARLRQIADRAVALFEAGGKWGF